MTRQKTLQWQKPETGLPERQRRILDVVRDHLDAHGYPPSRPEIARALGIAHVSSVDWHLMALMRKGWIEVRPDTQRGLRLLREGLPVFSIESIAAGEGVADDDHVEERMPQEVAKQFSPRPDYFLAVRDGGGNKWGVADQSLLAIATNAVPKDGDVVVVRLGEPPAPKLFKQTDERLVELCGDGGNNDSPPVVVDAQARDLRIEGVVVGALIGSTSDLGSA